jgi:hypothetical protein
VAPKARGTFKHLHVCLMPFLINLVFISFYWRRRRHPMPDLDRLVLISTVVKLMGQQKNDPAWTGLPLRLKTYEQQSHSDTVKLQAKRECLGDRGKTERPCHPTIKYFVRYLKQFSMAAESSSRTKLANSSMTMISSGAQRHSIRPSGISLKLGCC